MRRVKRVKKRTFFGAVCIQEVFDISPCTPLKSAEPQQPRFKSVEEYEQYKIDRSKRKHAQLFNANFSPTSLYSTLTFDNENEVHTFTEAEHIRRNYIRRLKRAYPDAVIFSYMGRGKNTSRIHMHMVSNNIPEDIITAQWLYGTVVRVEQLREHNYYDGKDYGQDYTGLANYLFDHWTPEQGGKRWSQTRNAKRPEAELAKEIKRNYSEAKPPKAPKGYMLVESKSTQYGYLYFKYVLIPPKRPRNAKRIN